MLSKTHAILTKTKLTEWQGEYCAQFIKSSKNVFLFVLVAASTGCTKKAYTSPTTANPQIEVQELKGKFHIAGEKTFLSTFRKTVATSENNLISWASYLDGSAGAIRNINYLYDHAEEALHPLPTLYQNFQIIGIGKPYKNQIPVLIAEQKNEFFTGVPIVLIWNLVQKKFVNNIPLTREFCERFFQIYLKLFGLDESDKNLKDFFVLPGGYMNLAKATPYIEFISDNQLVVVLNTALTVVGYNIQANENLVSEKLLIGPSLALPFFSEVNAFYFDGVFHLNAVASTYFLNKDEILTIGDERLSLPANKANIPIHLEWHLAEKTKATLLPSGLETDETISPLRRLGANQFVQVKNVHKKLNENKLKIDFIDQGRTRTQVEIASSNIDLRWAELYQNNYLVLLGEFGHEHAPTLSLTKPGALFILVVDVEKNKIVLNSQYYTGQQHRFTSAGFFANRLWISFNHNYGGNHDMETVRRTTSGRVFIIDLPNTIDEMSYLQFSPDPDSFSAMKAEIKLLPVKLSSFK